MVGLARNTFPYACLASISKHVVCGVTTATITRERAITIKRGIVEKRSPTKM